jgi:hypothetical protein
MRNEKQRLEVVRRVQVQSSVSFHYCTPKQRMQPTL